MITIQECSICLSSELQNLWSLPNFPLTERFGPYQPQECLPADQELVICTSCGHVQLRFQLDPKVLYSSHYSFRTAASSTARHGSSIFIDFLNKTKKKERFNSLVDVGGNDLYLLKLLADQSNNRAVIDPICSDIDGQEVDGIKIFGKLIEEVDLKSDLEEPDLVVLRHTFEHVSKPRRVLEQLFSQCKSDCLYIFEIPCFDNLVEAQRFDAIFHQHYQYYTLNVLKYLIQDLGGKYLDHLYNRQGSCGGSLLVAFQKSDVKIDTCEYDVEKFRGQVLKRIANYELQMKIMGELLNELEDPVYGYGAGLMLATLAYHLNTDFKKLDCVLDDDEQKDGMTYENIPVKVKYTKNVGLVENANFLITSLENVRPIYKRILDFNPRRVISPLIV